MQTLFDDELVLTCYLAFGAAIAAPDLRSALYGEVRQPNLPVASVPEEPRGRRGLPLNTTSGVGADGPTIPKRQ